MKCQVNGCGNPGVAKNMCDKHYRRQKAHGFLHSPRPSDWGKRSGHPLYDSWRWMRKRTTNGVDPRWDDFWCFVEDVGERPSSRHTLRKVDDLQPIGPENFYWKERAASTESAKEYQRAYRKKNPLAVKSTELKKQYGFGIDRYMEMLERQGGVCWICKGEQDGRYKYFSVDHCHETNTIRGLLCNNCNRGLGFFKDSPKLLRDAAFYLELDHAEFL